MTERAPVGEKIALIVGTGLSALLTMVWMAWAGRVLGPAEASDFYGGVFLIFAVYMVGHPLNGVSARFAALWRGEPGRVEGLHQGLWRWLLGVGVVAGAACLWTLPEQARALGFQSPVALGLAELTAWLVLLLSVSRGVLRGVGAFTRFSWTMATEAVVRLSLGVGLLCVAPSVTSAMWAYVIAALLTVALARALVRRTVQRRQRPEIPGQVWSFALPMLAMALADAAYQNVDVLLAKRALSAQTAGQYGAMATLTRALAVIVQPFALMVIPLLTGRSQARGQRALSQLTLGFVALATLPMVAFIGWPEALMRLVYGSAFTPAANWMPWHASGSLACFVSLMLAQAFAALGQFRFLWGYCGLACAMGCTLAVSEPTPLRYAQVSAGAKALCLLYTLWAWRRVGSASTHREPHDAGQDAHG